jgi:hypothetical protein
MSKSFNYKDYNYRVLVGAKDFRGCSTVNFISPSGVGKTGSVYSSDLDSFHQTCKRVIDNDIKSKIYDLYSDFDIQKHKQTYINYLEVIIMSNGKVSYAVPSHQAKLEKIACHKLDTTKEELSKLCPREKWLDYSEWLMEVTGCISVWTNFYLGKANEYQLAKLEEMKEAGIYLGNLEPGYTVESI